MKGYCERCGGSNNLQCAHIIGRLNLALRWDERNALCLCYKHHLFWAHKEPLQFAEWFRTKYPDRHEYLMKAKDNIVQRDVQEYQDLYKELLLKLNRKDLLDDLLKKLEGV